MRKVSVNILNHNGKKFIGDCIDGLLKQNYPNLEIVFVDNASRDGSVDFVKSKYAYQLKKNKLKILEFSRNEGFAGGYNKAFQLAKCDYFLLLNNDVKIEDKSLITKLVTKINSSPKICSVGCVDLPFKKKVYSVENSLKGGISIIQTNIFDTKKRERVFYVGGVCCLVKKKYLEMLFEEDYFAYAEDVYLGFKINFKGLHNVYVYNTFLFHHGAGTSGRGSPFVRFHSEKNRIKNMLYFYDQKTILKIIPLFLIHQFISYATYLIKPKIFSATLRAHLNILFNLKKIFVKRKEIQEIRSAPDESLLRNMSYKLFSDCIEKTSYKILDWPLFKEVYYLIVKIVNNLSKIYCSLAKIKTREFFEDEKD